MNEKCYQFIKSIIQEAGTLLIQSSEKRVQVSIKNDDIRDLVTNVDIELSKFITEKIKKEFPDETIYSEESADVDISSGSFWSIDPIDGTSSFARGIPHFAIAIVYIEKGVPVVGAVFNPKTRELFSFLKDNGAFLNDKPVTVSKINKLSLAQVFFRVGRDEKLWDWGAKVYKFLLVNANKTANFGSSVLDMCFVGAGRIEACIYGNVTVSDVAAAIGFVREAGGIVVGLDGSEITKITSKKQTLIGVNNREILSSLRAGIEV